MTPHDLGILHPACGTNVLSSLIVLEIKTIKACSFYPPYISISDDSQHIIVVKHSVHCHEKKNCLLACALYMLFSK